MDAKRLARFDWVILKPLWVSFVALSCIYCFRQEWLVGLAMIGLLFLIGVVGASLHRTRSAGELAGGYPRLQDGWTPDHEGSPGPDSAFMVRASCSLGAVMGTTIAILLWHHGIRLLWAAIIGGLGAWLSMFLIVIVFGMSEWLSRRSEERRANTRPTNGNSC